MRCNFWPPLSLDGNLHWLKEQTLLCLVLGLSGSANIYDRCWPDQVHVGERGRQQRQRGVVAYGSYLIIIGFGIAAGCSFVPDSSQLDDLGDDEMVKDRILIDFWQKSSDFTVWSWYHKQLQNFMDDNTIFGAEELDRRRKRRDKQIQTEKIKGQQIWD